MECDDPRVQAVCANSILERAWGKPKEFNPDAAARDGQARIDVRALSAERRQQLREILEEAMKGQPTGPGVSEAEVLPPEPAGDERDR
jgi:hypothetical protein